jgi:hypothetical protein
MKPILKKHVTPDAKLMTDEAKVYANIGKNFANHESVVHGAGEYVCDEIHTNTAENFFSIFKRHMIGEYQHCGQQHLKRYLHEFDFRYKTRSKLGIEDAERADLVLEGIKGKR